MVWSVFCDGVASDAFHRLSGVDIIAIIGIDIFMYLFGCAICILICRLPWPERFNEPAWVTKYRFSRADTVAVMVIYYLFIYCMKTCEIKGLFFYYYYYYHYYYYLVILVLWCNKNRIYGYSFN